MSDCYYHFMKKIIIVSALLFFLFIPLFAADETAAIDAESAPEFGLQSNIFRYVLTSSNSMLSSSNGFPTNFGEMDNYPLTPGDVFTLLINYGANTERSADYITTYNIQLQPDYTMVLPFIGKTDAKDKSIAELQKFISARISEITPVQFISFNLTTPANFNVFIYGGVNVSGYINASPVTTVIDAIAQCQGFKTNASYRDVRIIRGEQNISIDISDFYRNADFDSNPRLQPGDKLYVPMAETIVNITGNIKYPGTYELLSGENLDTLLNLAGGLSPGAWQDRIQVARITGDGTISTLQTGFHNADSFSLQNGDTVSVPSIADNAETITIEGAVYGTVVPGTAPFTAPTISVKLEIPFFPGISLLNVLDQVGGPTPYAVIDESEIRREDPSESIKPELSRLWRDRDSSADVKLNPGDHILIPLKRSYVAVLGAVNSSSSAIEFVNGYKVLDYIIAAGGFNDTTANPNNIKLIDDEGKKHRIALTDEVAPGSIIYVEKNILYSANDVFSDIFVITGWATVIITFVTAVMDFAASF